jgi:hypothetical protein
VLGALTIYEIDLNELAFMNGELRIDLPVDVPADT